MTKREAAIVGAYTGIMLGKFSDMQSYVEKIMERPIFTHEFADKRTVELIKGKAKLDFLAIEITNGLSNE